MFIEGLVRSVLNQGGHLCVVSVDIHDYANWVINLSSGPSVMPT